MNIKTLKILLAALLLVECFQAADIVWTNTAGGNWGAAANRSPYHVPGGAYNAFIANPSIGLSKSLATN